MYELKLPKMGESIEEATIIKWLKNEGESIHIDDIIVEIATDKVDSDVPSEVAGTLLEKKVKEGQVAKVGEVIAIIGTENGASKAISFKKKLENKEQTSSKIEETPEVFIKNAQEIINTPKSTENSFLYNNKNRFYSPLIRNIAKQEKIPFEELEKIEGTGKEHRVTKDDILAYLKNRHQNISSIKSSLKNTTDGEIVEMNRMEKILAEHMIQSRKTSAHVQSFVEADVTILWDWREENKEKFAQKHNEKLTFTPIFIAAISKTIREYPLVNSSIDGNKIIKKKDINIGMATALPNGSLIVPVIKNADKLNLSQLAIAVNGLAERARNNKLKPDEIKNGTYTLTNVGNSGAIMGTPIINQPQVGIMAMGVIRKMPAVIETKSGDIIAVRKKIILSHSYDHRIINGVFGGLFTKRVAYYLENIDILLEGIQ